ncbi:MAG TPA: hypothetical protein DD733_12305 [Clostridiales bacterium]|nr:hypothetical protein [Clostridiales bacterium]
MISKPTRYYGEVNIPEIKEPSYWSDNETDYEKVQNLVAGLPQQIISYAVIDGNTATPQFNTPDSGTELTDGKLAEKATYTDKAWFRFTRGLARSIIFDLKNISAITGYSFGFLKEDATAVRLPATVTIAASENGVEWQEICHITGVNSDKESDVVRITGNFDGTYRTRFVKIYIPVYSHVYMDEISIFGTKKVGEAKTIVPDPEKKENYPEKFASPDEFNNIHDVLLSYICHPNVVPISKDVYLPHVAYIEDGVIKDTLFDSFMFLPYVAFLHEGYKKKPLKKEDWQLYIDTQFVKNGNLDALEEAVGEVKAALGCDDYKVSLVFSILFPVSSQNEFGEIDGKMLDFSKLEDRKTAIKWLIDEQIRIFNEKGYKNTYIQGFYWFTEEIDYSDSQLLSLIDYTTKYVRSLGFITSWIPYYQASGFCDWQRLGFDLACYQPNYAFNYSIPDQRLFDAAETAKLLGMCIELEIGGSKPEDVDRLKKYYAAGAITGYMTEAVHMYYQGGVPGSIYNSYISKDSYLHSLYADTYKFMKGRFKPEISVTDKTIDCPPSGSVAGMLSVASENTPKSNNIVEPPKNGTVELKSDGSFIYTPANGFSGEDSFKAVVDFGYDISEPVKVTINVK